MFSKQERLEYYKQAKLLISTDIGFCSLFADLTNEFILAESDLLGLFPELKPFKPANNRLHWFPLNEDGLNMRLLILTQCISKLSDTTSTND